MPSSDQFIAETLEETVRARRRRLHITESMDFRLLALQTVDNKIDRNVRALGVFGAEVLKAAERQIDASTHHPTIDALVHIAAACAAQLSNQETDTLLIRWFERFGLHHRTALRDAWWFYPLQHTSIALHATRIMAMVRHADRNTRLLGVELAGRWGVQAAISDIQSIIATKPDGLLLRMSELSLCRLGQVPKDLSTRIQNRSNGTIEDALHALRLLATTGQLNWVNTEDLFRCTKMADMQVRRLGWCLATLRDPVRAHNLAHSKELMDPGLRSRVLALAGFPQGLVAVAREIAAQTGPATASQMDALQVYLGEVPAEVSASSMTQGVREHALRSRILRLFQETHVAVTNEAKHCAWEVEQMLTEVDPARSRRLRFGRVIHQSEGFNIALAEPVTQLCTLMRQALYIEQAVQARRPVGAGLSAYASARYQVHSIGLSSWIGDTHASSVRNQ